MSDDGSRMRRAAIVNPLRTPIGRFLGGLKDVPAGELAAVVIRALIERTGIDPGTIDDVVFAQGYANGEAPCVARWAALAAGLPVSVPGYQLDRRCGSGLQAIIDAAMMVQTRYARYLPMSTAPRGIGRVNRYVIVLSSTSSAISDVP